MLGLIRPFPLFLFLKTKSALAPTGPLAPTLRPLCNILISKTEGGMGTRVTPAIFAGLGIFSASETRGICTCFRESGRTFESRCLGQLLALGLHVYSAAPAAASVELGMY